MSGDGRRVPLPLVLAVATVLLLGLGTMAILAGSVGIGAGTVWRILAHRLGGDSLVTPDWSRAQDLIIADSRLPRVLLAGVVGAGLSLVGVLVQAVVRNPLAGPSTLGVASGASAGAVLTLRFTQFQPFGDATLPVMAFVGALGAILTVVAVTRSTGSVDPVRLVLAGVAISSVLSALTSLMVLTSPDQTLAGQALQWTLGGFGGAEWDTLALPAGAVLLGATVIVPLARNLNVMLAGDESATALGLDVPRLRLLLVVLSSALTGVLVALSGTIGFIGLMVPHVSRFLVGSDHRRVLPVSMLVGAIFAIGADLVARTAAPPTELPVGIITSLIGGPYFVWLLRRTRSAP